MNKKKIVLLGRLSTLWEQGEKMKICLILLQIPCVLFALFLVACNQAIPIGQQRITIAEPPSVIVTLTDSVKPQGSVELNKTPGPTLTITSTARPTPTSNSTVTQTALPPLTPMPTWTLLPTLPSSQAQEFSLNIVRTNRGCKLPCWLGITPGKTTWSEAYGFLATFADEISPQELDSSYVGNVTFKFPDSTKRGAYLLNNQDGVVIQIESPEDISLPDLLTTYGPPSEIRIHAIGVYTMDPVGRFALVLFYQARGIMAVYNGENEKSNFIHICPSHILEPQYAWLLWSPTEKLTFADAGKKTLFPYSPEEEEKYIPLEKLTGMAVKTFYEQYKDPNNQGICIYIQAPDWP